MVPDTHDRHALPVVIPLLRPGFAGADGPPAALTPLGDHPLLHRLLRSWRARGVRHPVLLVPSRWVREVAAATPRGTVIRELPDDARRCEVLVALTAVVADTSAPAGRRPARWAVVHDAEAALVPPPVHDRLASAAQAADTHDSAARAATMPAVIVPGLEVTDSVKRVAGGRLRNVDRTTLRTLQHPRLVRADLLPGLIDTVRGLDESADEIAAAQHLGLDVRVVQGAFLGGPVADPMSLWQAQISLGLPRQPRRHAWIRS